MKANVIQSGSDGNCTILENVLALDMGISFQKVMLYVGGLKAVFLSHEHGDHFKESTIRKVARCRPSLRFCCGKFLVKNLLDIGISPRRIDILEIGMLKDYGSFQIEPVELFHDVPNYGCKVYMNGEKACYFVDTGTLEGITAKNFDLYLVEANHLEDEIEERASEKLAAGQFAYEVRAAKNHLSCEQACTWIAENAGGKGYWIPMHEHKERGDENAGQDP